LCGNPLNKGLEPLLFSPALIQSVLIVNCSVPLVRRGHKVGHANGNLIVGYGCRTFIDHSEFKEAIADTLCQNILPEKYVLRACRG
jgi:hypothetical protein